jgi:hypothetical protein
MIVTRYHCWQANKMRSLFPTLILILYLLSSNAQAGFHLKPVTPGFSNELGLGVSYGVKLSKDAQFFGYAPDYVRVLSENWLLNVSFAYDKDTEFKKCSKEVTETWTPSLMIGYQLSSRLALGVGLGHGLFENKDGGGWTSVKFGNDLTVAAAFATSLWNKDRHGLALSVSFEYNISDKEPSISTDLGYSFAF